MKIAIIGAGAFGTALGGILADNGYDIDYYDSRFKNERLIDVVDYAKYILLAIPSDSIPYVLPHLPNSIPLIVASKGLFSKITFADFKDVMILSGPGFADDIKAHKDTYLTITDKRLGELFKADYLHFDYTNDYDGVFLCGTLKNIYAIEAGILNLERDTTEWNSFINDVSNEMKRIIKANGANPSTVDLYCGIGDLKLTCGFPSRNFEFGQKFRLNQSYKPDNTVEGLSALDKISKISFKIPDDALILKRIMERNFNAA